MSMQQVAFSRGDDTAILMSDGFVKRKSKGVYKILAGSFFGSSGEVKAARAIIADNRALIDVDRTYYRLEDAKYERRVSRLPKYGQFHFTFRAVSPRLLIGDFSAELEAYVMSDHINTPVLREWMPFIEDSLRDCGRIEMLSIGRIEAYYASFGSKTLDQIVSAGIREGKISF